MKITLVNGIIAAVAVYVIYQMFFVREGFLDSFSTVEKVAVYMGIILAVVVLLYLVTKVQAGSGMI